MKALLILAMFAVLTADCLGESIFIVPSAGSIQVGQTYSANIDVSGLTTGTAPALGAYQLDFAFDNTLLSLTNVVFGSQLSLNGVPSLNGFFPGVGSAVTVFESSFNTTAELESGQPDTFNLFTISFLALATGTSPLTLQNLIMADAKPIPNEITSSFTITNGSLQINQIQIPEPSSGLLLISGLLIALLFGRKRVRRLFSPKNGFQE